MLSLSKFMEGIQKNVARIKIYRLGGDGSGGECDCVGLGIGAQRLAGEPYKGVHGSNYYARNCMSDLEANTKDNLYVGKIVFKAYPPNDPKWTLPGSYKDSPDQNDYYHWGVVTSVSPLVITHCTGVSGGIKRDSTLGKWSVGGHAKVVDYADPTPVPLPDGQARVNASAVALRQGTTTSCPVILRVPKDAVVEVLPAPEAWSYVKYNGRYGWMMNEFLSKE